MNLTLAEEIVLLGLDDETGKCVSQYTDYAFHAGVLAELQARARLSVSDDSVRLTSSAPLNDAVLDEAVSALSAAELPLGEWIRSPLVEHGRERILHRLVDTGILEKTENKLLGLFTFRRYPLHDMAVENEIRRRLRAVVLDGEEPGLRLKLLLSLAAGAGLLKTFLSHEERKQSEERIRAVTEDEPIGRTLRRVIDEDEAQVAAGGMFTA